MDETREILCDACFDESMNYTIKIVLLTFFYFSFFLSLFVFLPCFLKTAFFFLALIYSQSPPETHNTLLALVSFYEGFSFFDYSGQKMYALILHWSLSLSFLSFSSSSAIESFRIFKPFFLPITSIIPLPRSLRKIETKLL